MILVLLTLLTYSCLKNKNTFDSNSPQISIDTLLISGIYSDYFDIEMTRLIDCPMFIGMNDSIKLSTIVKDGSKMVLFITEASCFECISKQLEYIEKSLVRIPQLPFIIISSTPNTRDVYGKMLEFGLDFSIYSSNFTNFGLDPLRHSGPLFFILDQSLLCKFSFSPLIHSEDLTLNYLSKAFMLLEYM